MVHLFGLKPVFLCCGIEDQMFSTKEREEEGFTVHAGADEHEITYVPNSCPPDYRAADSLTGKNFADLVRIAKVDGWPGYFGRHDWPAQPWVRKDSHSSQKLKETAPQILDGLDYRRFPDTPRNGSP